MLPPKLAFVDVETTGLDATTGRIIEIGILRVENNRLVETFTSLVNPHIPIDPVSLTLTGITQKELEKAPTFYAIAKEVCVLLQDCVFVAHNVDFDYQFVRTELKRHGRKFSSERLCTVQVFRRLYPNAYAHNLDVLIERFGFECERRHRAFNDAQVLWEFYRRLQRIIPQEDLENALSLSTKRTKRIKAP